MQRTFAKDINGCSDHHTILCSLRFFSPSCTHPYILVSAVDLCSSAASDARRDFLLIMNHYSAAQAGINLCSCWLLTP